MRLIPPALQTRLQSGATTLCWFWRITRKDGAVFGFCDHDAPLVIDGLTCAPHSAPRLGAIEKSSDLSIDTAQFSGALNSAAIEDDALTRGLWDGAAIELFRVDWMDPTWKVHVFSGALGEVRRGAQAFEAEVRGVQAALNAPRGRVFARSCDADVGDGRCGVDLSAPANQGAGIVSAVLSGASVRVSGLNAFADGWFSRGRLTWDLGGAAEIAVHRAEGASAVLEGFDALTASVGAGFIITAGCDKRFATCKAKFTNGVNFRGFPHMPGNDAIQAAPVEGAANDGGSRNI